MFLRKARTAAGPADRFPARCLHEFHGLLLETGTGEVGLRPLTNQKAVRVVGVFRQRAAAVFGLFAARPVGFEAFMANLEAFSHQRPSLVGGARGHGPGSVRLGL